MRYGSATIYAGVDRIFGGETAEPRDVALMRELAAVTPEQLAPEVEVPQTAGQGPH